MFVKVCGITRQEDLDICKETSIDYCGFIFDTASKRYISPGRAAEMSSGTIKRVGVFTHHPLEEILRIMDQACLDYAQLHSSQPIGYAKFIGPERVFRVLWPERHQNLHSLQEEMKSYADTCFLYLLDAGIKSGGSGKTLNWKHLKNLSSPKPWILAGGLSPFTLPDALGSCSPNGIDLNSGVEVTPGRKSKKLIIKSLNISKQKHIHH